jgi:hypothetical protein
MSEYVSSLDALPPVAAARRRSSAVWAALGAVLLAVSAASGILYGLSWRHRYSASDAADDVDGRHRREDVDPGVLVLMLAVPLVVGGAVVGSPVCRPGKQADPPPAAAVEEARGSQV